ncbi:hypothetical protein QBC40DRAFT_212942 [Triangularia verruculosa]|uniref:RRM domain-containing protein n=1 Tax=Triangularia verruculosa TaxID=2587418 RepID=A0AAN7AR97_9PEZI|nr:hypothetical protein QBC40DRAFT_212942 [Triangularia verruculosa]
MARTAQGAGKKAKAPGTEKKAVKANGTPKVEKRKATEDASPVVIKKQKAVVEEAPKKSALKKEKKPTKEEKAPKKAKKVEEPVEETEVAEDEDDEEVDADTQALVEALDSENDDEQPTQISETFKKGQDVGKVPKSKKAKKEKDTQASSGTPGVVYLGRIPHGFYEHELRSYFGQFGDISKLRVVRNKKTGASRHRAFIEFAEAEVADIAARTMDKYLLFGHLLTAKVVPPEQVHPDLFKGANRRFKVIPWNKMAGNQLERPLSESQWQAKITKEEQRRLARAEKLKDLMDYEFDTPQLKAPEAKPQLENGTAEEEAPKEIEAPPAVEEKVEEVVEETVVETKVTKVKKTKAAKEDTPRKGTRSSTRNKKTKP